MDREDGNKDARPRRESAGTNRNLFPDYVWPDRFGMGNSTIGSSLPTLTSILPSQSADKSLLPIIPENQSSTFESVKESDKTMTENVMKSVSSQSGRKSSRSSSKVPSKKSQKSQASIDLQRKKLALQMEKERQELEEKQIENRLRILRMEHELKNAELDVKENEEEEQSVDQSLPNTECSYPSVAEWVQQTNPSHLPEHHHVPEQTRDDIQLLCQTISNVMQKVAPSDHNKLLTRYIVDKDFPVFDGNPEDWLLFYQRFEQISKMCDYSKDEILVKLQKSLRGDAKSAVAGMLLSSNNVDLIMNTLRMRFGRPDYIVEVMISKVRAIPPIKDTNIERLIQFANEVRNLVATMKALLSLDYLKNPQLIKDLVAKLPDMLRLRWGEVLMKKANQVCLEDFSTWINDMATAASLVSSPKQMSTVENKFGVRRQHFTKKAETVLNTKEMKGQPLCFYCENKHNEEICPKMKLDDVEKRWKVITDKKCCFSCLGKGHQKFKCRKRQACGTNGCKFFHHPLLHKTYPPETDNNDVISTPEVKNEVVCSMKHATRKVLLRMIPVKVYGPNGNVQTLAICDEASTVTLVDESISKQLGLRGDKEALCIQWTNGITSTLDMSERVNMNISGLWKNSSIYKMSNVRTVEKLSLPSQTVNMEEWNTFKHLKNLPIENIHDETPMILIGQDNINLIVPRQIRCGSEHLPIATKCKLGWSLHGSTSEMNKSLKAHTLHICNSPESDNYLHELVKQSFSTESFGVSLVSSKPSRVDSRALEIMQKTAKKVGNRYEIGLLWKDENIELPESKTVAFERLKCMERKFRKNNQFALEYCQKIESYLDKGYARKLSPDEAETETSKTWYLPHFSVENPNKPGKFRLVFDAAAKSNGISLNDNLLSGPDLLQPLTSVLWKFRQRKYGICGDVREMFHQIRIREADQCAQRFLWRGLDFNRTPDTYEMLVMTFGATCSPVCAQYVKNLNTVMHSASEEISNAIITKFYVDDYLDSVDTEEEAVSKIQEVCRIHELGGFQLVNWISNSDLVRKTFSEISLQTKMLYCNKNATQRILGVWWDSDTDELLINLNFNMDIENNITKRQVLRYVMSIFDPLGLLAFFTVRAKILMQDIWREGIGWDENLPANLQETWKNWFIEQKRVVDIKIPRCYTTQIPFSIRNELHVFCDASQRAFATAVYLRVITETTIDVSLVSAKSRVAPLKQLSVPRLELQAAVMASRLSSTIKQHLEIKIDRTYFWTDSKCVLLWIKKDGGKFKQFVSHRVGEIQEFTNTEDWRWVPTSENIADEATRETTKQKYEDLIGKWFYGPDFLKNSEKDWPTEKLKEYDDDIPETLLEMKNEFVAITIQENRNFLPDIDYFSKWIRLIRSTAWLIRFVKKLISKYRKHESETKFDDDLTVPELKEAEKYWIKVSQGQSFPEDIQCLEKGVPLHKRSRLNPLSAALDEDGLLILDGRTNLASCMEYQTRKPFILSPKHRYTKLLLQHYHEKFRHQGVEMILNEVRQKFWVIDGRAAVKSTFAHCLKCAKSRAKPQVPKMGQLPTIRLTPGLRPFINVGMDYFGPLQVTVGRRREKRWGVLFTCMAVRAIHLEVAHSLTTDSAIMAIRRMIARRGKPSTIICDNGTNLRGASEELRKALAELRRSGLNDALVAEDIIFKFIPPASPHMGGAWERLIGIVKKTIGAALYDQSLRDETLLTLFAEAENIVNCRPLTHVSVDPADPESLTPNHFLIGYENRDGSPCVADSGKVLRQEWRKSQMLANIFWRRWVREYLPTLSKRAKWTDDKEPLKIGDIVIIVDERAPRNSWTMGRVEKLYPGKDGHVRVVDVKTRTSIYRRPVSKLCRLKLESEENQVSSPGGEM